MSDKIDTVTDEMAAFVCDKICKHPYNCTQEELDAICCECKLSLYIREIMAIARGDDE